MYDKEELLSSSSFIPSDTDIDLFFDTSRGDRQIFALRFTSINIPLGAQIMRAFIIFKARGTNSGAASARIFAENIGNAPSTVWYIDNY